MADISVLHVLLLAVTAGPVEVVGALLLCDPVQDEVVAGAQVLLLYSLCNTVAIND